MQDFTKQNTLPAPIQHNKWLSKDRFWTLIFALGMTAGFSTALFLPMPFASILFWSTLIGMPVLVKIFNGTTHKGGKFFTSEGREINLYKDLPKGFIVVVTTVAITALLGLTMDKNHITLSSITAVTFVISTIFFIPTLFFVYKNCPISIFFNASFWKENASIGRNPHHRGSKLPSMSDYTTKAEYSYMPQNINYKRRHR